MQPFLFTLHPERNGLVGEVVQVVHRQLLPERVCVDLSSMDVNIDPSSVVMLVLPRDILGEWQHIVDVGSHLLALGRRLLLLHLR